MIGSPNRRSRAGLWFAAFTILSLLMLLSARTDPATSLQQATARALDPVRAAVTGIGDAVTGVFGAIGEIDRLRSDNDQLRRQLAGAQQRITELQQAAVDNAELRALLGLTKQLDMQLLPVRVISRDPSNFTWEVGIDAGSQDGVRVGMPVVGAASSGAGALAGTVVSVWADRAQVRFVVDTRSSVVAEDQQTQALGEAEGQLGGQLVFVNVPVTEKVSPGDTVISAGLTLGPVVRSPYPRGLLLGTVDAVQPDENALTQTAFVQPAIDYLHVDRLLVVTSFTQG
jgi:rod shape-determining protein MreC